MFQFPSILLFLLCLFLLPTSHLQSQNPCNCPSNLLSENAFRDFDHSNNKDPQVLRQLIQPLLQSNNATCQARAHEFLAEQALGQRQMDSAQNCLNRATDLRQKAGCLDKNAWSNAYNWAEFYYIKAKYQESLDYYLKALTDAENNPDAYLKPLTMLKIAQIFNRMKQPTKGLDYTRNALPLVQKLPLSVDKAFLLTQLAARYFFFYQDTKTVSALDSTFLFTKMAKELGHQFQNKKILILTYSRLENAETMRKNWTLGLLYNDSVLMHCDRSVHFRELYVAYGDRGDKYMDMGNLVLAQQFADSAVAYARKNVEANALANALSLQYEVAKKSNNWQSAVGIGEQVMIINDSIQKVERSKAINELEKKYNQAKNEKTIKELAQEKRIYLLLAITALLLAVAIAFYLRQQSLKHQQKILETEQRLNRARMNPHFFFNALTSLQSFALRENDGKALATNLSKFSNIMRETLESTYKEYVTIEQEMDFLNEYLEIQKIRFPQKFSYAIHADDDLEIEDLAMPSMIIQPFVENSIEHGFANLPHEGHVDIHFSQNGNELLISISDNGNGLAQLPTMKNEHISRASQIIKDRIYLLNLKLKTAARFSIENKTNEKGVLVKIYLPVMAFRQVG